MRALLRASCSMRNWMEQPCALSTKGNQGKPLSLGYLSGRDICKQSQFFVLVSWCFVFVCLGAIIHHGKSRVKDQIHLVIQYEGSDFPKLDRNFGIQSWRILRFSWRYRFPFCVCVCVFGSVALCFRFAHPTEGKMKSKKKRKEKVKRRKARPHPSLAPSRMNKGRERKGKGKEIGEAKGKQ